MEPRGVNTSLLSELPVPVFPQCGSGPVVMQRAKGEERIFGQAVMMAAGADAAAWGAGISLWE